jgi:predicted RND superfamily exporter protein
LGLMVCLFTMLTILPLLLPILDSKSSILLGVQPDTQLGKASNYRLAPMGLMVIVLVTGFVGATKLTKIGWEYDISTLRRDGLAYEELSADEQILARESYSPVVVSFPDRRSLTRDQNRINKMVEEEELRNVARAVSIESVLPSDQSERLAALRGLQGMLDHTNLRYLPPPLVKKLLPLRGKSLQPLTREDLPPGLLTVLGAGDESKHRILVFPKGNMWDMREAERLSNELARVLPNRLAAGEYISIADMYRTVNRDLPIIAIMALIMVTALTTIDLRKLHWVAGAMFTLIVGMVWSGAAIQTFGVKFSMLNVVGIPILLGIGIDVVIHLLHRLREEGPGGVRRALATTGVAALVSTLTTVLSFVSLLLAGNRGVRSLGLVVVIGLIAVFVASAIVLPTVWAAGWKVTGRAPSDTGVGPRPTA